MLKIIRFIILVFLIFYIFFGYPVFAQEISIEQNQEFLITLRTEEISNLSGFMVDISFNPDFVAFTGAVKGDFLTANCKISLFNQKVGPGVHTIGMRRLGDCSGVSGSGNLVNLNFKSLNKKGITAVEYGDCRFCILKNKECDWRVKIWDPVIVNIRDKVAVLGVEHESGPAMFYLPVPANENIEKIALSEAEDILSGGQNVLVSEISEKIYNKIINTKEKNLKTAIKNLILYFIQDDALTSEKLGIGERAGVVNSYFSAFNKFPETAEEWQDVIKIANGRWPNERSAATEKNAEAAFKKIYKRNPDRNNFNDDAAVTIISYGLRPINRNMESEKAGIKIFKAIYGYIPKSAEAWDIVRAIAYSGATR